MTTAKATSDKSFIQLESSISGSEKEKEKKSSHAPKKPKVKSQANASTTTPSTSNPPEKAKLPSSAPKLKLTGKSKLPNSGSKQQTERAHKRVNSTSMPEGTLTRPMSAESRAQVRAKLVYDAVKTNSPDNLQVLIESGFELNVSRQPGDTLLDIACGKGQSECVQLLLEGNIALPDSEEARVDLLVKFINAINSNHGRALSEPKGRYGSEQKENDLRAVLAFAKRCDGLSLPSARKILSSCISFRTAEWCGTLLGALLESAPIFANSVNVPNAEGQTLLMKISEHFDKAIWTHKKNVMNIYEFAEQAAKVLLRAGAKSTGTDHDGCSALYFAMINLNTPLAKLLLDNGASLKDLSKDQINEFKAAYKDAKYQHWGELVTNDSWLFLQSQNL